MVITSHSGGDAFAFQAGPPVTRKDITCEDHLNSLIELSEVKIDPTSADGNVKTSGLVSESLLTPTLEESIIDCSEKSPTFQSLVPGNVSSLVQLWGDRCMRETFRELNPSWRFDGDELKEKQGEKMRLRREKQRYVGINVDNHVEKKDEKEQHLTEKVAILDENENKSDENEVILDDINEKVTSSYPIESENDENVKEISVKDVSLFGKIVQNPQDLGGKSDDKIEILDNKAEILDN